MQKIIVNLSVIGIECSRMAHDNVWRHHYRSIVQFIWNICIHRSIILLYAAQCTACICIVPSHDECFWWGMKPMLLDSCMVAFWYRKMSLVWASFLIAHVYSPDSHQNDSPKSNFSCHSLHGSFEFGRGNRHHHLLLWQPIDSVVFEVKACRNNFCTLSA